MQEASMLSRIVGAYKSRRLLSGALRRIPRSLRDPVLRFRSALPASTVMDLPAIVMDGDFASSEGRALEESLQAAINVRSKLPQEIRAIEGMSGQKYRTLINTLVGAIDRARYLEIGSWLGSTATAAIYGNEVEAVAIDNWSQFSGSKERFLANVGKATSRVARCELIEDDFRSVDYRALGKFNVYFFDGPHHEHDHTDAMLVVQPCLAERFVLVIDDWNWPTVRLGTMAGLVAARCQVEASLQVRTTNNDTLVTKGSQIQRDWHNGYLVAVVRKKR